MKKSLIIVVIVGLLAMLTLGCASEIGQSSEQPAQEQEAVSPTYEPAINEEGTNFKLLVSDEKNDIDHFQTLNVTISRVGVHQGGESGNWTEWDLDPGVTVNLTELQGTNATAIWSGVLEDGLYNKVFLYVSDVTGVLVEDIDGEFSVKLPSGKLQISKLFEVSSGNITEFVYDITVIKAGKSGKYILKPQISESGADQEYVEVGSKSKPEDKGKPDKQGKPEGQESGPNVIPKDKTAPVINISGVNDGENITGNVTPTFEVYDETDPDPTVNATLNDAPFVSGTELSETGDYELVVTAVDASGNEAEASVEFKIIEIVDIIAPVIIVDGVSHGENITGNTTITFEVSDETDPDPTVNATLNDAPFVSGTEVTVVGEYELIITAVDTSGNEAEVIIKFEIKQDE
jgi:hypothetical protein